MTREAGLSLPELLVVTVIAGLLLVTAGVRWSRLRSAALTAQAARRVAVTLHSLRWRSVAQACGHGLWFRECSSGWCWHEVRDGNGNGVRVAELHNGTDSVLGPERPLSGPGAGPHFGFPRGGPFPRIPPASGWIGDTANPIHIGRGSVVAFGPGGGGTGGTLYISDGERELHAVVVFGRTGRIRVWRLDADSGRWSS